MKLQSAKVALVFDWMTNAGGAEKVNLCLHRMFPKAPIFTSIYNKESLKGFENADIRTSFIQKLPFAKQKHQWFLHLMPYAYESFDLSSYDIVISSSHSCAKGVVTKPETLHVCYCHSPMRYAWDDWQTYIKEYKTNNIVKRFARRKMHKMRIWDRLAADRVDYFIANSKITQKRIEKYYRRPSTVIHPGVDTKKFSISKQTKGYFLAVGRLIPYKKFDMIIEAFNELGLQLKIVGTGIMKEKLQKMARPNIEFLGFVNETELSRLYSECEALIFPQVEDFGIIALEAMSSGRPVIAYKKGGSEEMVVDGKTGIFFEEQDSMHLKLAVEKFIKDKEKFNSEEIKKYVEEFDEENFERKFSKYLQGKWESFSASTQI